jgi:hypothetical protein
MTSPQRLDAHDRLPLQTARRLVDGEGERVAADDIALRSRPRDIRPLRFLKPLC